MTIPRRTSRLLAGIGIGGATLLLLASPAAADTSQASAKAARVTVLGADVLNTATVTASNDGTQPVDTDTDSTGILGTQTVLIAGVLGAQAVANPDGTSAACAGALAPGGVIQIGPAGECDPTVPAPNGVNINLNGLASLQADAIYAECTASSTGPPTGRATLLDADLAILGQALPSTIDTEPAVGQGLNIPGIASLILNEQTTNANGSLTVNALHLTLLPNALTGQPAAEVIIGSVTCGPNAVSPDVSIFSGPALPAAAAGAAVVSIVAVRRRRRVEA